MSVATEAERDATTEPCFLGLDVGGTQARWALATATGALIAEGTTAGFSGAGLASPSERENVRVRLSAIADAVHRMQKNQRLYGVHAGVTGAGADAQLLEVMIAKAFALVPAQVTVTTDVELSFHAVLSPGEGYLVYAGTGSIAAFIDASGTLHRAGGRGVVLDDAGGGYWIAREALRRIWRREDEQPGAWQRSPMACALFPIFGGETSIYAARYLMEKTRGEIGMLARVVAEHAAADTLAAEILSDAGAELARLANALTRRLGERKIAVAGRAAQLHPLIEAAMRRAMPRDAVVEFRQVQAHVAAARIAAKNFRSGSAATGYADER